MKRILFIITILFATLSTPLYSQMGIYTDTPDPSSVLDINNFDNSVTTEYRGLLLPRMTTAQKEAIVNPAHSLLVHDTDKNCIAQNLGSETAPQWDCLTLFNNQSFYMPSINIQTSTLGTFTIDLFQTYKDQFSNPKFTSVAAPASIPQIANATDLYYYVTYHDPARITINSINANGVMSYTTTKKANYNDYINIVFMVK